MTKNWGLTVSFPSILFEIKECKEGLKRVLFDGKVNLKDGCHFCFNPGYKPNNDRSWRYNHITTVVKKPI